MRAYILLGGFLIGFLSLVLAQEQENKFLQIVDSVLYSNHNKLEYNDQLKILLYQSLTKSAKEIQSFDSNGLIYELQDEKARLQILSWAIQISDKWEYFAYVKSYNEPRKKYVVWELLAFDLWEPQYYNSKGDADNWPGAVYYKLIEKEYRDRKYYTLLGWLPEKNQTAFKVIEVLTISKSGRLSFGKSSYFSVDKNYYSRILFAYSSQTKFLLDYGAFSYMERKWSSKKKKYLSKELLSEMIVYDELVPLYPDMKEDASFLVPIGNRVNAFVFEKGKWRKKADIDARNLKKKTKKKKEIQLNLLDEGSKTE